MIRLRTNWTCERCGALKIDSPQGLDASHLFSRVALATRWHPLNCFAHCRGCHQWLGDNPVIFTEWAEERIGADTVNRIRRRFHAPVKLTKADKEVIYDRLKSSLKNMEQLRAEGRMERIDFASPYDAW